MRILLASWGSSGDLIPFLSLGAALRARGHGVTLVGNPEWEARAAAAGLRFVAAYREMAVSPLEAHPEIVGDHNFGLTSFRLLLENAIVPILGETMAALEREAVGHDLLVAHHFVFPAALVHEKTGIPWATVALAPGVTPSAEDLPAGSLFQAGSGPLARLLQRLVWKMGTHALARIVDPPLNRLRAAHGLPPFRDHMFAARSARLVLHLYSRHFAPPPRDWDGRHAVTGFCFDDAPVPPLPEAVERFLAAGPPPRLFTLGTTVVAHPRDFYRAAAASVAGGAERAILLVGREGNVPADVSPNVLAVDYLPHRAILPRCAAAAHQCGVGTLAEVLRAGIPAVACPFAFDQPNNAARLARLGVARIARPSRRTAAGFRAAFAALEQGKAPRLARELAERINAEDGPARACAEIERRFGG
jgi:rhamnosyltransferase subunit B